MSSTTTLRASALRRTIGLVTPHLGGQRRLLAGGGLALLLEVVFRVLEPWPVKLVVDAVTRSLGADLNEAGPSASVQVLLACALATVSIVGLRALSNYLATVAFALAGSRVATALRQRVFGHVTRLDRHYHSRARSGDVVQRIVADVGRLQEVAVTAGMPLVVNVVTLLLMLAVMLWLDAALAVVVVVTAALFWLLSRTSTSRITDASRRTRRAEGDLASLAQETIGAMPVVQAYGLEPEMERRFGGSNARSLKDGVKARRLAAALERRTDVLVGVATAVVLLLGGHRVMAGAMTPGDLVIFLTYLKTALKPLRDLAKYTGRIARAAASGERVADLLEVRPGITSPATPWPVAPGATTVELEDVHADYGDGVPVLRGVTLRLAPGERVALVGPSGSGKSTVTALLTRTLDPTQGAVRLGGVDIRRLALPELRRQVALVLQESVLFSGTVADNIRYGRLDATDEEVRQAARLARVDEFVQRLPDGYDTVVGERGATLSGGQRQRIAVARAFLRDAPVVLLDEATTGLDADNAGAVRDAVAALTRGRTTLVVTHDEETARDCDRVVRLEHGRLVEAGPGDGSGRPRDPEDALATTGTGS